MGRGDFGREVPLNIFSIFSEFVFTVRESEYGCFDGGVPSAGPFTAHLDLLCWFWSSKGNFSRSHASNVLFRSGYMMQWWENGIEVDGLTFDNVVPFWTWKSEWSSSRGLDPLFDDFIVMRKESEDSPRFLALDISVLSGFFFSNIRAFRIQKLCIFYLKACRSRLHCRNHLGIGLALTC